MEPEIVVYPYQDVWRFKPSNSAAEPFSHDYPTEQGGTERCGGMASPPSSRVMAINILAPKIDRLGELSEQLAPVKPLLKEYEDIRKDIVAAFSLRPADEVIVESGKVFEVEISAREEERLVNLAKLAKKLGPKKFLSVVTVPMKLLDQHVSPEDQKDMVTLQRTGGRRVKVKRKGQKEAA